MDNNTIAVVFFLVVAPVLCALSIPVLSWLEGRNTKKQAEINAEIDRLHQ
jgi:hypothetical protein